MEEGKAKIRKKKIPKSNYCAFSHNCDKEINCRDGNFCSVFQHTKLFTSLRFEGEKRCQVRKK
jgi:hypothetical protein